MVHRELANFDGSPATMLPGAMADTKPCARLRKVLLSRKTTLTRHGSRLAACDQLRGVGFS
jgi:hypothetical protein